MTGSLDRRTRQDADRHLVTPTAFFEQQCPALLAAHGDVLADAMVRLGARPLTMAVDGEAWTIALVQGAAQALPGHMPDALLLSLSPSQFSDWAQNQISLNGLLTQRCLSCEGEDLFQVSLWDSLSLTLLEGWPAATDGLAFVDRQGRPLDLQRGFTPDDDPADIAHFLREAGYLHLKGWLDPADMTAISADMDRVLPSYAEGDGKSWWATTRDGSRVCVRMQDIVDHSPTTAGILTGDRWEQMVRTLEGPERYARKPIDSRIIEALVKPVGVVAGPSDLSFHRDCHLGRHAYACARMTVGIALTPARASNGLLRVVAGSHRVAMPVEVAKRQPFLPVVALATNPGDMTVHLSCTLHEATAPVSAERRVMYTEIPLAQADGRLIDTPVGAVRERVNDLLR